MDCADCLTVSPAPCDACRAAHAIRAHAARVALAHAITLAVPPDDVLARALAVAREERAP